MTQQVLEGAGKRGGAKPPPFVDEAIFGTSVSFCKDVCKL